DFEDSLAPDWNKVIDGQINLRDAVNGTISYTNEAGKIYQLKPTMIEMPLNQLPATVDRETIELKFDAAKGKLTIDAAQLGGLVS
ncbi:hypothetical protein ONK27_28500, partial [Salmonella enterica subsp. enterica serovar Virginia]|nr:hypothetical protein [Salmonella enterica subsp. enterica serovar Virginia]